MNKVDVKVNPPFKVDDHVWIREHTGRRRSCGGSIGLVLQIAEMDDLMIIECITCKSRDVRIDTSVVPAR